MVLGHILKYDTLIVDVVVATNHTCAEVVHPNPPLHAVASCALLAQLVLLSYYILLLYMKGAKNKKIVYKRFLRLPGVTVQYYTH